MSFISFSLIAEKIDLRETIYGQTWREVPVEDLISVARLKMFRAMKMLKNDCKEKLIDDLIDAAAYIIFALERVVQND